VSLPTRVLAATAVALLSLVATGAATSGTTVTAPTQDRSTILVKWVKAPPVGVPAVGELKTKVKIVKVPLLWTVQQTIDFYKSLPNVAYAEPNYVAGQHGIAAPNDYFYNQQWALARISAQAGWAVFNGGYGPAGAPIAVVDTGIDASHPDLAGQVQAGANCLTGICTAASLSIDDNGHGTLNAGAAAATANNGIGIAGVAHGAKLIPVKVLNATGSGTYAAIAAGIIWAADNGAKVINLSLGGTASSRTLCDAVQYALDKGVFVDAASGNLGISEKVYPASCPGVVGVGATDPTDAVPAWSDTGVGNVFVTAPGVLVHGTYPGNQYALGTGTSVATALVSGVASLLEAQDATRTPADVRAILALSSDKVGAAGSYGADPYNTCTGCTWSPSAGYGRINVYRALTTDAPESAGGSGSANTPPPPPVNTPAPDFGISAPASAVTAQQGTQATFNLSIAGQNGFNGQVALAVTGLPAGATATFAPTSVPASGSSALKVSVAGTTPAGSYTLTITGTSGSLVHTATAHLVVTAAPPPPPPPVQTDFTLIATPGSTIVKPGTFKTISLRAQGSTELVPGVQLSASGLPAGVTVGFTAGTAGTWTMRIDVAPTVPKFSTANITVTGTLGTLTKTTTVFCTFM
jgi:thermitase